MRHIITCEYPPQSGGVSDYTELVAQGLAATGDVVHVWCPPAGNVSAAAVESGTAASAGLFVHRELGRFTPAALRRVGQSLDQFAAPRQLLVQWVPQGYGYRSLNLPFCFWLWQRARLHHDQIEIMVHEPFLAFSEGSIKQDLAAAVHRFMIVILLKAASCVWVSIPDWETCLRPFVIGKDKAFGWLPVPSNIPVIEDAGGSSAVRARYAFPGAPLVGHFGAYDRYLMELMLELLPRLLARQEKLSVMLVGRGSIELRERLIKQHSDLSQHVRATGELDAAEISRHLSACDLMLQPYQDGVSGRRTSVMTALAHGIAVVTTTGKATESIWAESNAVSLVEAGNIQAVVAATERLLSDKEARDSLSNSAISLYRERFDLRHVVSALRRSAQTAPPLETSGHPALDN